MTAWQDANFEGEFAGVKMCSLLGVQYMMPADLIDWRLGSFGGQGG
jgi:hypothetical protein